MYRKIKTKIILITVVLLAISIVYKDKTPDTYAKEEKMQPQGGMGVPQDPKGASPGPEHEEKPGGPDTPDETEPPERPDPPTEPEKPDPPTEPDTPDPPTEPERPIQIYQLQCPEPDGKNGYYITKPEIIITHVSEYGVTKFRFADPTGQLQEGELKEKDSQAVLSKEQFQDGRSSLTIWMEDEDGQRVEDSESVKEFLTDTLAPDIQLSAPSGLDAWYQEGVKLEVSTTDGENGSQVEKTACYIGGKCIGTSKNPQSSFYIQTASVNGGGVAVTISAVDCAGNKRETTQKLLIDNTPPKAEIQGIKDYMITSRPLEVRYHVEDENAIEQALARTEWEHVDGQKSELPGGAWTADDTGQTMIQQLAEDGVYRLSVSANDKAGYEQSSQGQVIIDSHNPVIRYVDILDHKYLKEFCWDYPLQSIIQDYSSYIYEIRLDEKLYTMGKKVTEEGAHILKVKATDAAGNSAQAKARFTIDRTAPRIQFLNIEEDGIYEEHRTFKVTLADQEDRINEIQINGAVQKINPRSKVYEYEADECKDYLIEVKASDKAGNDAQSQIRFQVAKKETAIEKLMKPVTQRINGKKSHGGGSGDTVRETKKGYKWMGVLGIVFIVSGGTAIYYIKRKRP